MRGYIDREKPGSALPRGFFRHDWTVGPEVASPESARRIVVAIPVRDEGLRVAFCLHALAVQVAAPPFGVLLVVNNCSDNTRAIVEAMRVALPFALRVVDLNLLGSQAHAGWARRIALDAAAAWLESDGCTDGLVLSSDADTLVGSSWVAYMCDALATDADLVSGRVAMAEGEIKALPGALRRRLRREAVYDALLARVVGHYDPQAYDAQARHLRISGANLAIRATAYRAAGGLPPHEHDAAAALAANIVAHGQKVRHVETQVQTSARLHGRIGAMRTEQKVFCDAPLSAVMDVVRVAKARGAFRHLHGTGRLDIADWAAAWQVAPNVARKAARQPHFSAAWAAIEAANPNFRLAPLRSSELATEIALARKVVAAIAAKDALMSGEVAPLFQDVPARIGRAIAGAAESWRMA